MTPERMEIILDILAVLLSAFIVFLQFTVLRRARQPLLPAFFFFAMTSQLLSEAYWLAYTWMRPTLRMPLAANLVGECAVFLLLAAMLDFVFRDSRVSAGPQIAGALIYSAASVALWIAWSGEWIQDILGGFVFGYFLFMCVRALRQTDALSGKEWIVLGILCGAILAGHVIALFLTDISKTWLDLGLYAVMFGLDFFFLIRSFRVIRRKEDPGKQLALTVSAHAWCMSVMYMSAGYFYSGAMFLGLLTLPLMFYAVGKEARVL